MFKIGDWIRAKRTFNDPMSILIRPMILKDMIYQVLGTNLTLVKIKDETQQEAEYFEDWFDYAGHSPLAATKTPNKVLHTTEEDEYDEFDDTPVFPLFEPPCECGAAKTYGLDTILHSRWCPAYEDKYAKSNNETN